MGQHTEDDPDEGPDRSDSSAIGSLWLRATFCQAAKARSSATFDVVAAGHPTHLVVLAARTHLPLGPRVPMSEIAS